MNALASLRLLQKNNLKLAASNQLLKQQLHDVRARSVAASSLWKPDASTHKCTACVKKFSLLTRKHHCRCCGDIFCNPCSSNFVPLPQLLYPEPVRICDGCFFKNSSSLPPKVVKQAIPPPPPLPPIAQRLVGPLLASSNKSTPQKSKPSIPRRPNLLMSELVNSPRSMLLKTPSKTPKAKSSTRTPSMFDEMIMKGGQSGLKKTKPRVKKVDNKVC